MKVYNVLLIVFCSFFIGCGSSGDDPADDCIKLQQELNEATAQMQTALGQYVQNTTDGTKCSTYAEALRNRIQKAQAMINANCLSAGATMTTEQAIMEDQAEIDRINC